MSWFSPNPQPKLPQNENAWRGLIRRWKLSAECQKIRYDHDFLSPTATIYHWPATDEFSLNWLRTVGKCVVQALDNRSRLESEENLAHKASGLRDTVRQLIRQHEPPLLALKHHIADFLRLEPRSSAKPVSATSLQDFANLFKGFGIPLISQDFREDSTFAAMRVAGPNPVMLQRLTKRDERLPLSDKQFAHVVPGDSLDAALAAGRLYLADYSQLDGAELGSTPSGQKYLYAPLALFAIVGPRQQLTPVAIQCQQRPGINNPILTPGDGYNWLIAKTIVETADANVHEASTHFGKTHLLIEPFVAATYRCLATRHPLAVLLSPHFEATLAINGAAYRTLIAEGGPVDKLSGGTIQGYRQQAIHSVQSLQVKDEQLPQTFALRGVEDCEVFPCYPYRDDSLLYWSAIHRWVDDYLRLYYLTPTDIALDYELQSWCRELASREGGRIQGLPNDGSILSVEELIELVTFIVFTCSVQHAAVNGPQYDCMSYTPNMPLAGYRPAPTSTSGATEADFLAMLPTLDMAELQAELGYVLGSVIYTELGQYPASQFTDRRVTMPLARFQQQIVEIGKTIELRNQSRRPYQTLAPASIPQSINI